MNKHSLMYVLLFLWGNLYLDLQAISLVYNLKIRRSFTTSAALGGENLKWVATAVPIAYYRKRHIEDLPRGIDSHETRLTVGSLFNIRYHPTNHWWGEVTTGIENEFLKSEGTLDLKTSRFGLDDLVFSAGYNFFFPKGKAQFVPYMITGFPLNQKLTIQDAQDPLVGTRFYNFGVGSEISYSFIQSLPRSLSIFFQNRFIRFFRRSWEPILPVGAKIDPGNVIDILFAGRYRSFFNIFEVGYNPTFFTDQAIIVSAFEKIKAENFVRHGWYGTYSRGIKRMPLLAKPGLVGAGFSATISEGFKTLILSGWFNITLLF